MGEVKRWMKEDVGGDRRCHSWCIHPAMLDLPRISEQRAYGRTLKCRSHVIIVYIFHLGVVRMLRCCQSALFSKFLHFIYAVAVAVDLCLFHGEHGMMGKG